MDVAFPLLDWKVEKYLRVSFLCRIILSLFSVLYYNRGIEKQIDFDMPGEGCFPAVTVAVF